MPKISRQAALFGAAFLLVACADIARFGGSRQVVELWAGERGFTRLKLDSPPFELLALVRLRHTDKSQTLTIYIEGDGAVWPRPHLPPADPTPLRPVALALAAEDRSPVVAYLGRPCQYLTNEALARCSPEWWTSKRFSSEVLAAYQKAVDQLKASTGHQKLRLVGYSGGGVIAALLADHRQDVVHLTTIATPLSLGAWTAWHGVSPLPKSLDPATMKAPSRIPALHYVGADDQIVPERIVRDYVALRGGTLHIVANADHDTGWLDFWKTLQQEGEK